MRNRKLTKVLIIMAWGISLSHCMSRGDQIVRLPISKNHIPPISVSAQIGDKCVYDAGKKRFERELIAVDGDRYTILDTFSKPSNIAYADWDGDQAESVIDGKGNLISMMFISADKTERLPYSIGYDSGELVPNGKENTIQIKNGQKYKCKEYSYAKWRFHPLREKYSQNTLCLSPMVPFGMVFFKSTIPFTGHEEEETTKLEGCTRGNSQQVDIVVLNDGSVVRGNIIKKVLGEYVIINTSQGKQNISWEKIKEVQAGKK